jgi:acyl-coenzyme A thioesterase PaaI-like protein
MEFAQFDQQIAEELQNAAATAGGLSGYLDFRHIDFTAGRLVVEMDARDKRKAPFGNLHGG